MVTGCSTTMMSGDEVRLSGTSEGIAALGDVFTGMQVIAKTEAEQLPQNPHHALRVLQNQTKALRFTVKRKEDK